jgi:four helix bundle protein
LAKPVAQSNATTSQPPATSKEQESRPDIQARSFELAVRVLKLVRAMPRATGSQVIARQIARSGTSIGANVEEAQGSHSKADFVHRMNVARREARETHYWLRLIAADGLVPAERLADLAQEAEEVVRILTAIVKTARGA